jgi:hypothetical protein
MVLHREASPGTHNYDPIKRRESCLPELAANNQTYKVKNGEKIMEAERGGAWNTDGDTTIYKTSSANVIALDRPQPIWEESTDYWNGLKLLMRFNGKVLL